VHSVSLYFLALHVRIFEIFYYVNRKKKTLPSSDNDATAMESADTFHQVASIPPDDRNYYNLPPTNVNVADQDNYTQFSAVRNDNHTYSQLNTTAGQ